MGMRVTPEVKSKRDLYVGVLLAAGAHVIMAFGILMVRDIYREVSLVWVSGFRFLCAVLVLALIVQIRFPQEKLFLGFQQRQTWKTTLPMSFFGPFLATICWVAGFKYLTAGRAAIYNQLSTVFIVLLAWMVLKERMTPRKCIGLALAIAGSLIVATH